MRLCNDSRTASILYSGIRFEFIKKKSKKGNQPTLKMTTMIYNNKRLYRATHCFKIGPISSPTLSLSPLFPLHSHPHNYILRTLSCYLIRSTNAHGSDRRPWDYQQQNQHQPTTTTHKEPSIISEAMYDWSVSVITIT